MTSQPEINGIYKWHYNDASVVEHFIFKITKIEELIYCDILYRFDDHDSILYQTMNASHDSFNKFAKKLSDKEVKQWKAKCL